ncbi:MULTISPECIES: phosphoglucosamine mutase [Pelosinus]|uniref:Phosphoglucosamine mutase n=1 Tax=Pelosinus fermentans B4 TaxID=1149862 RepID=I9AU60_9FIRM|nr:MULTISPECIES: phosphoglucosamine mutase [Pelosinus]EIW16492.1 phosphoglucosamine mutase [Pelosinus fermentans B4]EIW22527.1 phosphoglucosamine mutase [Pelosinus fermentans A11]OAM95799.1 phosphoglucosamine mutase [Pelosinus fermentans DSM 17108]SDR32933.1 phosphoglucosamine mutase [Pelosinus fermentans]
MGRLFGTDGVRGVANAQLTPELAFKLGWAATTYFGREYHTSPVMVIGRDTRVSGHMLEAALAAGICSAGGHAVVLGVVPTPAVAYLAGKINAQAGIVISASHNPYPDNGIKFFAGSGYKLPDAVEDELEKLVFTYKEDMERPVGDGVGTIVHRHDLLKEYIDYLLNTVDVDFTGLTMVVDCAHGAAYEVGPIVYERLGAKVITINNKPTGVNINADCGSTHMEGLQEAVMHYKADFGIAHDGDADRCLAVDEKGAIVDGDQMMVICALDRLRENKLKDNTLVATVMSNIGLYQAMKKAGGKVEVTAVGDRYVLEAMREKSFILGGEQSGHVIFAEHSTTGDGVLTALQLIAALKKSGKTMAELAGVMTRYPQLLVNVCVASKDGWEENEAISRSIEKSNAQLGENGRILVRPSGTEQLIRVMAEGPCMTELEQIVHDIAAVVKKEQG